MSNFLNTLISRENGRTAHAVAPRLPSRYEAQDQKAPSAVGDVISHQGARPLEPHWEASRGEAPDRGQEFNEFNEVPVAQSLQSPDSKPTSTPTNQKNNLKQDLVSIAATAEYEAPKANANIDTERSPGITSTRPAPIPERKASAASGNPTQIREGTATRMSEPGRPPAAPTGQGTQQAPHTAVKPNADGTGETFARSESVTKPPLPSAKDGTEEIQPQRAGTTVNHAATTRTRPALGTPQNDSAATGEPVVSTKSSSMFERSIQGQTSKAAVPRDELFPKVKPEADHCIVMPNIRSRHNSRSEGDTWRDGKPVHSEGQRIPQQMHGRIGNAFGSLDTYASSLLPNSGSAARRSQSTETLSPQREFAPASKAAQPEPAINVSIGRIEVRAFTQPPAPKRGNQGPKPMSLDEYLNKSSQRGR